MAFDTLGVNVVASGIRGVAGDIGHLALSFLRYVRAVQQADKASAKTAASQSKLADTMAGKAQRNVSSLEKRYVVLTSKVRTLQATIQSLNLTMRDPASAKSNYDRAIEEVKKYENAIKSLEATARRRKDGEMYVVDARKLAPALAALRQLLDAANAELNKQAKNYAASTKEQARYTNATAALTQALKEVLGVEEELPKARQAAVDATQKATDSQLNWAETVAAASNQTGIFGRLLSDLTGGFGAAVAGNSAFAAGLGVTVPHLGAMMVAMDALKLGVRLAQAAFNAFVAVVRTVWNVLKKLVSIVWDVAKAIGKTLWNAVKKIATAPFNLVSKLFGNMGGSMQRVMEMAIGMNLSRVWWQLGMKIRDMAKMASDAAVDYQVTFNRLRTLILNEISAEYGQDMTVSEYEEAAKRATVATEELVKWTSKLAVSTIYDAEDILNVYTLAMSYGFASTQAEKLTEAVLDFASGMGLGDTEMKRVIENFGQMRAQGKITGTELRDLARGAFVPVNEVLEEMAKNAGLIGDYDVPNMQSISTVLAGMAENGELTADAFAAINTQLGKLGADGKITRQEFEGLVQDLSQNDVMAKFGLSAEQAGLALEGIKTGALTADLNELIKTGKLTVDEFFEAFIEIVTNKYPNAARSMGLTMKAVKSNISDFISTMIGWRVIAPVFEVVAKHTQDFIQNVLMSDKQIASFDRMGKAFKVVTELLMTYSTAMRKMNDIAGKVFGTGPLAMIRRFATSLLDVVGALGTEEFQSYFVNFERALSLLFLPSGSNKLVVSGIKNLNSIMKDIMEGVEIDPAALKKSLDDVFGTLWREFFGPKIKEGIDLAWSKHVSPAIGKLWQRMKNKFAEWKTDKLMPWIKTFFGETLPKWISSFGTWIKENGPRIIADVGQFASDILTEFTKISAFNLGENSPITRLLDVFRELVNFATFKITDPTSEINVENLGRVSTALGNLALSLKDVAINSAAGKSLSDFINGEEFERIAGKILVLAGLYDSILDITGTLIHGIIQLLIGFDANSGSAFDSIIDKMTKFVAHYTRLVGILTWVSGLIYTIVEPLMLVTKLFKGVDWAGSVGDLIKQIGENVSSFDWKAGPAIMDEAAASIKHSTDVIKGIDTYAVDRKVQDLVDAFNDFSVIKPTPLNFDVPVNVSGHVESASLPLGIAYDGGLGKFVFGGASVGQSVAPPITYVQPFTVNGQMDFKNLPQGYTYNESTGLLEFDPIIADLTMKRLPIITLEQPITIDGKTYYNLPPGFSVNQATGQLEWKSAGGEVVTDPIIVKQKLDLVTELLSKPGWGIDPYTGAIVWAGDGTSADTEITQNAHLLINMTGLGLSKDGKELGSKKELIEQIFGKGEAVEPIKLDIPVETGFQEIITNAADAFKNDTTIQVSASAMAVRAANAIKTETGTATTDFQTFTDGLSAIMETASGPFATAGTNAVAGLKGGMESEFEALLVWWIKQVARLNAIVPRLSRIESPSKLYYKYGENMMKGLQLGLESGQEGAVAQMHDAAIELRQALGAIGTGTISPQQYNNVSNTTNWNVNVTTPLVASTPIQAYEILRMRAR